MAYNPIDFLIAYIAPHWGARRMRARAEYEAYRSLYESGKSDRVAASRTIKSTGPLTDFQANAAGVLAQARETVRNNPFISGVINSIVDNVVGCGIELKPQIGRRLGGVGRLSPRLNGIVTETWNEWGEAVDPMGRQSYTDIQRMVFRELYVAGECLIVFSAPQDRVIPMAIEVVESERLDRNDGGALGNQNAQAGNAIIQGIEVSGSKVIVAYHIYDQNPNDVTVARSRFDSQPARVSVSTAEGMRRVLHIFELTHPGAMRGMSRLLPISRTAEGFNQFLNFALTRARIAASFAMMIKRAGSAVQWPTTGNAADDTDANNNPIAQMDGGMIYSGGRDDSIEGTGPAIQDNSFEPFVTHFLRQMAVGLNVSYELLSRDFTKTNFSSARQSALEDRRHWESLQNLLNRQLNTPVFREFEKAAALSSDQAIANFYRERQRVNGRIPIDWAEPGWAWVDPIKEIDADIKAVASGLKPIEKVLAKYMGTADGNLDQLAGFLRAASDRGLSLSLLESVSVDSADTTAQADPPDEATPQTPAEAAA